MIDHVGYLVRDLEAGIELVTESYAAEVTREIDRPQWSLHGYYVGAIEVFTFTDPARVSAALTCAARSRSPSTSARCTCGRDPRRRTGSACS